MKIDEHRCTAPQNRSKSMKIVVSSLYCRVFSLEISENRRTVVQNTPSARPPLPSTRPSFRPSVLPPVRPPSARPSACPSARAGAGRTYIHKLPIDCHGRLLFVIIINCNIFEAVGRCKSWIESNQVASPGSGPWSWRAGQAVWTVTVCGDGLVLLADAAALPTSNAWPQLLAFVCLVPRLVIFQLSGHISLPRVDSSQGCLLALEKPIGLAFQRPIG